MQELYKELILDLNKRPLHKHMLDDFDLHLHAKNPSCGDQYQFFIKYSGNKIASMGYIGDGCAISNAACSLLVDALIGKEKAYLDTITETDMMDLLGIEISFTRKKCALLALHSLQS